jgi:antitoxin PrlF
MNPLLVKLTSKYQATVPKAVRSKLHLKAKDQICYEILDDGRVIIRKAQPYDIEYLNALTHTLSEWDSEDDEKAYKNL